MAMTFARLLAASALVLTAAALDPPTAARALGLLLLLLCGAVSVWRWGARRRSLPAVHSPHGSKPGMDTAAGMTISHELTGVFRHASCDMRLFMQEVWFSGH